MRAPAASAFALLALVACRVDVPTFQADDVEDDAATDDGPPTDIPVDMVYDDGPPTDSSDGLTELIGRQWTVGVGGDLLKCVRIMVASDTYITELRGIDPAGTHHTVLAISEAATPMEFDCNIADVVADYRILFTSENGGSQYTFPNGVGLKIAAGTHLTLAIHLRNTTTSAITGRTSVRVRTTTAAQLMHQAELLIAGDTSFSIPVGTNVTSGGCMLPTATNLLAFTPHMHAIGIEQMITLYRGGSPQIAHDAAFDVNEQRQVPLGVALTMAAGDQISVRCTYNNTTGSTVSFGIGFDAEQCFATFLRYPAVGGNPISCAN